MRFLPKACARIDWFTFPKHATDGVEGINRLVVNNRVEPEPIDSSSKLFQIKLFVEAILDLAILVVDTLTDQRSARRLRSLGVLLGVGLDSLGNDLITLRFSRE